MTNMFEVLDICLLCNAWQFGITRAAIFTTNEGFLLMVHDGEGDKSTENYYITMRDAQYNFLKLYGEAGKNKGNIEPQWMTNHQGPRKRKKVTTKKSTVFKILPGRKNVPGKEKRRRI